MKTFFQTSLRNLRKKFICPPNIFSALLFPHPQSRYSSAGPDLRSQRKMQPFLFIGAHQSMQKTLKTVHKYSDLQSFKFCKFYVELKNSYLLLYCMFYRLRCTNNFRANSNRSNGKFNFAANDRTSI